MAKTPAQPHASTLSRAARALARIADADTQVAVAKKLGCAQASVSRWSRGIEAPSVETAVLIERQLGIKATWWAER